MKKIICAFAFCTLVLTTSAQTSYKGLPLLRASSSAASYRIGDDWVRNNWTISPQIESDSLFISCYSQSEDFAFHTDLDSISIKLQPGQVHKFYVSLSDTAYALTVVKGEKPIRAPLQFGSKAKNSELGFWYEQNNNNDYLDMLRTKFPADSLVKGVKTSAEKALRILHWVHTRWQHNGDNEPSRNDAVSILEEAGQGKNFRCVEYGIVATACLNAAGLKARTLGLMTKEVETTKYGAGHVLLEVYLDDPGKWALLDGQWDVMPALNNIPLNAVEFQKAIAENFNELEIRTSSALSKRAYVDWIYPYLYYFTISFDNRESADMPNKEIKGKSSLMLVPSGAKEPTFFQVENKIDYCLYTHSLNDFYAPPGLEK